MNLSAVPNKIGLHQERLGPTGRNRGGQISGGQTCSCRGGMGMGSKTVNK